MTTIKRTDREEVEKLLFEEFGGEVIEIEKNEIEMTTVLPNSMESLMELVANQNKKARSVGGNHSQAGQQGAT
ncbi:hypothetical protein [Peribacillus frigoritolerans]|uniref:hypothetical protein n=1 Tax=Peribacillus frigoritolerans TaxID=450367 RepID=UPI003B8D73D8